MAAQEINTFADKYLEYCDVLYPGRSMLILALSFYLHSGDLGLNLLFCRILQAAANAKNNLGMRKTKLFVSECFADGGPQLKRIRPRAKGR